MAVSRYEHADVLRRFQDEVNRLFDQEFGPGAVEGDPSRIATSAWTPAVDVREEPERYVIVADVPGVDPGAIEITMERGVLTIKGERRDAPAEQGAVLSRTERAQGSFHRRFSLPESADEERVAASSSHGVLTVTIPKKAAPKPRRIEVR